MSNVLTGLRGGSRNSTWASFGGTGGARHERSKELVNRRVVGECLSLWCAFRTTSAVLCAGESWIPLTEV